MIKEFTVDVKLWARGGKNGAAALLNEGGYMCCLGFLGEACGVPLEDMHDWAIPAELTEESIDLLPKELIRQDVEVPVTTAFCDDLMDTNDSVYTTDQEKIEKLTKRFSEIGIEIKFVNVEEGK